MSDDPKSGFKKRDDPRETELFARMDGWHTDGMWPQTFQDCAFLRELLMGERAKTGALQKKIVRLDRFLDRLASDLNEIRIKLADARALNKRLVTRND